MLIGATLRNKYSHIKSSGYGQQSPGRTPSRERPSSAKERGTLRTDHRGAQQGDRNGAQDRARKKERKPRDAGKRQEQTWSPADIARQKVMGNLYYYSVYSLKNYFQSCFNFK